MTPIFYMLAAFYQTYPGYTKCWPESNRNEKVVHIPQNSKIEVLLSDTI